MKSVTLLLLYLSALCMFGLTVTALAYSAVSNRPMAESVGVVKSTGIVFIAGLATMCLVHIAADLSKWLYTKIKPTK